MAILNDTEHGALSKSVDRLTRELPASLHGHTLAESGIGAKTGLNVVAVKRNGTLVTRLRPDLRLPPGTELVMVGADEQVDAFVEAFG